MSKTKINDPGAHHAGSGALIRRFLPYLAKYKMTLFLDLFCAALTTLCDIVLPKIMSTITNAAMGVGITLTAGIVLRLAALYFVLRIIDGAASYYMSSIGHIMGVHIETDMRRDAFDHLLKLDHTYYNNTKVGTIMGRITNDLFDVTEFAHHCPEEFFIAAIKIVVSTCCSAPRKHGMMPMPRLGKRARSTCRCPPMRCTAHWVRTASLWRPPPCAPTAPILPPRPAPICSLWHSTIPTACR